MQVLAVYKKTNEDPTRESSKSVNSQMSTDNQKEIIQECAQMKQQIEQVSMCTTNRQ